MIGKGVEALTIAEYDSEKERIWAKEYLRGIEYVDQTKYVTNEVYRRAVNVVTSGNPEQFGRHVWDGRRVFTANQIEVFEACNRGQYSAMRFDNLRITIKDYHAWCKQEGYSPVPINEYVPARYGCIKMYPGEWLGDNDQEEVKMTKVLYKLYAVNRRTDAHFDKTIIGGKDISKVLATALLKHADEFKIALGNPDEIKVWLVVEGSYDAIEDAD